MRLMGSVLAPVLSLLVLVLALFAGAASSFMSTAHSQAADGSTIGAAGASSRFVAVTTYYDVRPGDHVAMGMPWVSRLDDAGPHVQILLVEGGEGGRYLEGRAAGHVLHSTGFPRYLEDDSLAASKIPRKYAPFSERWIRPPVYEGKPHLQGLNGDLYDAVDVVVLYDRPAGMDQATWDSSRSAVQQASAQLRFIVARGGYVEAQPYLMGFAALAGVAALASTFLWLRNRPNRDVVPAAGALEALVQAKVLAQDYLVMLRDVLRVTGIVLALGGLGLFVALITLADGTKFEPWGRGLWKPWIHLGGLFVWLASLNLWWLQYRRIRKEMRRWQESASPL